MSNAQEIWLQITQAKHYPEKDETNGHAAPRVIPRYKLRGKSIEEVRDLLDQDKLLFIPVNGRFTGTHKHKNYALRKKGVS